MRRKSLRFCLYLVFLLIGYTAFGQSVSISGTIKNDKGEPVSGASVKVKGSTRGGSIANDEGKFSISTETGKTLEITAIGYAKKSVVVQSAAPLNIVLVQGADSSLVDVVVTAAGTKVSKIQQGFNTTVLSNSSITDAKPVSLAGALAGKVPGLQVSATGGGGLNPQYNITLRGQRSFTGNNQPLLVVDGSITTYDLLSNINPEDIESTTVLDGPAASALYGSQASNGVLIITTKHPTAGTQILHVGNAATWQQVAFLPKMQKEYGSGGSGYGTDTTGQPFYASYENESYGPKFNGQMVPLGDPLENGDQLMVPYSYFKDRNKFWQTGLTNQTDFSLSSADEKSSLFLSGQFVTANGTMYGDKFTRAAIRANGTRKLFNDKVHLSYNLSYVQNRYDTTSDIQEVYNAFLNMPGEVPITMFKDWQTNEYANPNGYYNPWYPNPYFYAATNRAVSYNDYFNGGFELHYTPTKWLDFVSNTNLTVASINQETTVAPFNYTPYATSESGGAKTNIAGSDQETSQYYDEVVEKFMAIFHNQWGKLSMNAIAGAALQQDYQKNLQATVNGLVDSGLYNLGNSYNFPSASNSSYQARQVGLFYDVQFGWDNYLFLHTTGREDMVSVLAPANRDFFYPSVDLSYVLTRAISGLKNISWLDTWKIRGSLSQVGNVNLGPGSNPYGAYSLSPIYTQASGYPYSGTGGFVVSQTMVSDNIKPEITNSWEVGTDFGLFKGIADVSLTWFKEHTHNQTVTTGVSQTTGFSNYLLNGGETMSEGLESSLNLTPINNRVWTINLNANYTYNNNKVLTLPQGVTYLSLFTESGSSAGSYAVMGYQFPEIMGTDYVRHNGQVVVDQMSGMPEVNPNIVPLGNANPRNIIGLTPSVRFKDFTLEASFEYRGGFRRFNNMGQTIDWSGMGIRTVEYNRQRFVFPNSTYISGISGTDTSWTNNTSVLISENGNGNGGFWTDGTENMGVTSNYVTSGSFWKWRELSITYTVPRKALEKIKVIKAASVSIVGRNLFIWVPKDNVYTDPEISSGGSNGSGIGVSDLQQPASRYYGFNVSVNF